MSNIVKYGSDWECLAVLISDLAVWTACFTLPLLCGNNGEDVSCLKSHSFANFLNSAQLNRGPLTEKRISGIPYLANYALSLWIIVVARVFPRNWKNSQQLSDSCVSQMSLYQCQL